MHQACIPDFLICFPFILNSDLFLLLMPLSLMEIVLTAVLLISLFGAAFVGLKATQKKK